MMEDSPTTTRIKFKMGSVDSLLIYDQVQYSKINKSSHIA